MNSYLHLEQPLAQLTAPQLIRELFRGVERPALAPLELTDVHLYRSEKSAEIRQREDAPRSG
jgi:hypothetical protein